MIVVTYDGYVESLTRRLPIPSPVRPLVLRLYPEGGDLVAGALNRVYFEAESAEGEPADVEAEIWQVPVPTYLSRDSGLFSIFAAPTAASVVSSVRTVHEG